MFVYGTLRAGQRNEWRWTEAETARVEAEVSGFDLLDSGWDFPYAVPGRGVVTGEVVFHAGGQLWADAVELCDRLEGFRPRDPDGSVYVRRAVPATLVDGRVRQVWMYVADARFVEGSPIASGDWLRR